MTYLVAMLLSNEEEFITLAGRHVIQGGPDIGILIIYIATWTHPV
jgi:hypothetical protein